MNEDNQSVVQSTAVMTLDAKNLPPVPDIGRPSVSHKRISKLDWRNKYVRDLNALATEFEDCDFRYSNFERTYFREAKFTNCRFDGARFIDCNFKRATFYTCDFRFVQFQRCLLELEEVLATLPAEPNIRRENLQNLRANAAEVGDYGAQSRLILQEVEASKRHYSYALSGFDSYYKKKYGSVFAKARAAARLGGLHVNGLVWGHGEKSGRLFLSCLTLLGFLTFINFWSVMPRVGWEESNSGLKVFEYVVRLFLDMSPDSKFQGFIVVDYMAVLMRYVYIGLFISVLYKSISHR